MCGRCLGKEGNTILIIIKIIVNVICGKISLMNLIDISFFIVGLSESCSYMLNEYTGVFNPAYLFD